MWEPYKTHITIVKFDIQRSLYCNKFCVILDHVFNKAKYGGLTSGTMCLCVISQQYWNGVTRMAVLNIQVHEFDF
jgi:hypothetical protein